MTDFESKALDFLERITRALEARPHAPQQGTGRAIEAAPGEPCFPNYGRAKGQPVRGAARSDLDFYRRGCEKTLDDPAKARFHGKERALLVAIEAEIARQSGAPAAGSGPPPDEFGPGDDMDIPF